MVFALGRGATLLLYDGSPFHPSPRILFDYLEEERAIFFRLTPAYVDRIVDEGLMPSETHDLSALRSITAGGSPFSPSGYVSVYERIKRDVHLASPAGGTDPMAALVTGNPIGPVWPGECQARALGIRVEVYDDAGRSVECTPGELVCTLPFPSMPLAYWNDPDGERYQSAYFSRYPNTWWHGDWAEITEHGGVIIYGHSDSTLNVRGIRIGSAEIYRPLGTIPEIVESVVVAQETQGESRIILFVRLRDDAVFNEDLDRLIRDSIRSAATLRHVPACIVAVPDTHPPILARPLKLLSATP